MTLGWGRNGKVTSSIGTLQANLRDKPVRDSPNQSERMVSKDFFDLEKSNDGWMG